MKKFLLLLVLFFSSQLYSAPNDNVIFFQYATKGTLAKLHDNSYILTLINVPDYLSYYIKNPKKSGMISLKQFVGLWSNKHYQADMINHPPHAAISLMTQNGIFINAVVAVANPSCIKHTLNYQVTVMNDRAFEMGDVKNIILVFDDIFWNPSN